MPRSHRGQQYQESNDVAKGSVSCGCLTETDLPLGSRRKIRSQRLCIAQIEFKWTQFSPGLDLYLQLVWETELSQSPQPGNDEMVMVRMISDNDDDDGDRDDSDDDDGDEDDEDNYERDSNGDDGHGALAVSL